MRLPKNRKPQPKESDYENRNDFVVADFIYNLYAKSFNPYDVTPKDFQIKTATKRVKNKKLEDGALVEVLRWDTNGHNEVVRIIGIEELKNSVKVTCDRGYFMFNGKETPTFKWNKNENNWLKDNQNIINPNLYYYET